LTTQEQSENEKVLPQTKVGGNIQNIKYSKYRNKKNIKVTQVFFEGNI